jgi:hypothetical protein
VDLQELTGAVWPDAIPRVLLPLTLAISLVACGDRRPAERSSGANAATPARTTADSGTRVSDSAATPARDVETPRDSAADSAVAVLRDYYAAVNAHDYARAYAAWAGDGPPGHPTPAAFAAGYAETDSVTLSIGAPSRVEGAAGSRYVSVPVTLRAYERGGRARRFGGSYTLRRAVVSGADAASRQWHLYAAELHALPSGR